MIDQVWANFTSNAPSPNLVAVVIVYRFEMIQVPSANRITGAGHWPLAGIDHSDR